MLFKKKDKHILRFSIPAKLNDFENGLFAGNGEIGASVLGGIGREQIAIKDLKLCFGKKGNELFSVSQKLKEMEKLLEENKNDEAQEVLTNDLQQNGFRLPSISVCPIAILNVFSKIKNNTLSYMREINTQNGQISVSYKDDNGNSFLRNFFVSKSENIICYNFSCQNEKQINFKIGFSSVKDENAKTIFDDDLIIFSQNVENKDFGVVGKVICNKGVLTKDGDKFDIANANSVFIVLKSFVNNEELEEIKKDFNEKDYSYERCLREHEKKYLESLSHAEINFVCKNSSDVLEDVLKARINDVPVSLFEKMNEYAKHLFACGIGDNFNFSLLFDGKDDNLNINGYKVLRTLSFCLKAGLAKEIKPILEKFVERIPEYENNALKIFNINGIYVPFVQNHFDGNLNCIKSSRLLNFNIAGLISSLIFEYYLFTDDIEFMKEKGIQFLEKTSSFYENFFVLQKGSKTFISPFGVSNNNSPKNLKSGAKIANNCTCDFVEAKFVFESLKYIYNILNDDEQVKKFTNLIKKVPDIQIDKNGFIKEYSTKDYETDYACPQIPHLFPYYVGFVPFENKRDFDDLVANSIKHRYINSFGKFSAANLIDMALGLCTCGDGKNGFEILKTLVKNFVSSNLLFNQSDIYGNGVGKNSDNGIFDISTNICIQGVLQNMFINSGVNGEISLFKTFPRNFRRASVKNLLLHKNILVSVEVNNRRGKVRLTFKSSKNEIVSLNLPNGTKRVGGVEQNKFDSQNLKIQDIQLEANKQKTIKIVYSNK